MKIRREKEFISMFDEYTGRYLRTGILKDGVETGEDFKEIARQCKGQTYQFALGGCGDPDQHENFIDILKVCREYEIVPNFTTSGFGMTKETAQLCKEYCGAVAVSWYRNEYTVHAIHLLLESGVKTNIHYVLQKSSISEALENLKNSRFPKGINAVVFLLHKPVGLREHEQMVARDNKDFWEFIEYIGNEEVPYKIGFDLCTVPALVHHPGNIDRNSLDTCEGARWSVDLRKYTIKEAWESEACHSFQNHLKSVCAGCEKRSLCMIRMPEVTLERILM